MRANLVAVSIVFILVGCSKDSAEGPLQDGGSQSAQCNFCSDDASCCNGQCVNTEQNVANCGECGSSCSATVANECSFGLCRCSGGPECQAGDACCGDGCADLSTSASNCGACGVQCGMGEACVAGSCECAADQAVCDSGDSCCGDGCTDTNADADNCGACGDPCEEGEVCNAGECGCSFTCPESALPGCCGDGCFDLCGDPNNCGDCGVECGEGESCEFGVCGGGGFPKFECIIPI